jgi:polyhydroxybutyrate depolymerase
MKCWATAVKRGLTVDPDCIARSEQRFADKFAAVEPGGSCPTTGDADAIEEKVDRFADDLRVAQQTGCIAGTVAPGDSVRTILSGGITRTYRLHIPITYVSGAAAPLLFNLHGGTSNANAQGIVSGMHAKSDTEGFLLIEPEGYGGAFNIRTWNAGNCCGPATNAGIDDVAFTDAMIDNIAADACVDAKRIFATGYSNGAMLSHRLACQLSDRIAAIAPNAGGIGDVNQNVTPPVQVFNCSPSRPVPVFEMHGLSDGCYNFNGGVGAGLSSTNFISIPTTIVGWAFRNGCSMTTATTYQNGNATCATYQGCTQGADVTLCTVAGMGHAWPGSPIYNLAATCGGTTTTDLQGTDALWDFFVAHPMP